MPVKKRMLDEVMVRRFKDDIRDVQGGFPKRRIQQLDIDGLPADAPELRLFALLDEYRQLRESRLKNETKRKQAAAGLLITGLQQRLLSSVETFAGTLRVHRRTVQRQWEDAHGPKPAASAQPGQLDLLSGGVGADDDRATLAEEELRAEEEAQIAAVSAATAGPLTGSAAKALFGREQKLNEAVAHKPADRVECAVYRIWRGGPACCVALLGVVCVIHSD